MGGGPHHPQDNSLLPVANSTLSYWRTQPHPLDEYQSSATLPTHCDIAIIGAGFSGVSTAYHLLKQDWHDHVPSIVILEARQTCSGATGRNGGHVKMQPSFLAERVRTMGRETVEEMHAFIQRHVMELKRVIEEEGIECESELRRSWDVLLDQGEAGKAYEDLEWLRNSGFGGGIEVVDSVEAKFAARVTGLKAAKGAISTQILSLWPYKFVTSLLDIVVKRGVQLHTNTPVQHIHNTASLNIMETPRGTLRADKVVFASNGYTAGLLPQYRNTIVPIKSTASHISVPADTPHPPPYLATTYNIRFQPNRVDYMNPRPDGSIVVGGGQWTYSFDKSLWYDCVDDATLIPGAKAHFDGLMQREFAGWEESGAFTEHLWTGIQGITPDGMPHVGRVPATTNQFILAGYNGGGNGLCFLSALGVAQMISHDLPFSMTGVPRAFEATSERLQSAVRMTQGFGDARETKRTL